MNDVAETIVRSYFLSMWGGEADLPEFDTSEDAEDFRMQCLSAADLLEHGGFSPDLVAYIRSVKVREQSIIEAGWIQSRDGYLSHWHVKGRAICGRVATRRNFRYRSETHDRKCERCIRKLLKELNDE